MVDEEDRRGSSIRVHGRNSTDWYLPTRVSGGGTVFSALRGLEGGVRKAAVFGVRQSSV